ncbi:MAG TPA: hypothetical protein VMJ10_14945 [Kofleriaceae bacterium]|nr:hypothetical protein [Kofleriaceae bacterium]
MAVAKDGDGSDRSQVTPLDVDSAPVSSEPVASSRTQTFETTDDELARALREQFTSRVNTELRRYAEYRAHLVRAAGRVCPPPARYARELVNDAYSDTWSGERVWNPERCSLLDHLRGVIDSRTSHEIQSPRQYSSFDAQPITNDDDDHAGDGRLALAETLPSSSGEAGSVFLPALVARTCHALRQAAKERDSIDIVRAWELGFIERDEVCALIGLDEAAYRRARNRLLYIAGDLPDELRQLVRDYLRST